MPILKRLVLGLLLALSAGIAAAQSEYAVRPGDTLVIEVLEDSALNRQVAVLPDGRFSFPFAGTLRAGGRTVGQIQSDITQAIASNFANSPNVFVSVQPAERTPVARTPAAVPTIDIYFLGEVEAPGLKQVAPSTSFLQGLAQTGGLTRFGAPKRVLLRRTGSGGVQKVWRIDYRALSRGLGGQMDFPLQDGDVIIVPERRLFE